MTLFNMKLGIFTLVLVIGCTVLIEATNVHNKCVARCWKKMPKCNNQCRTIKTPKQACKYFVARPKAPICSVNFTSTFHYATTDQLKIFMKSSCHEKPIKLCFENKRTHHCDRRFDGNIADCMLSKLNYRVSPNPSVLHIKSRIR
ncbi:hypothetical protein T265_12871 [Opisthorchis viverrini]|uniref:Uncharacterized protein n=1 Tax=Opisthorchis viverrini TaxID=6198 RepID=A0A074ZX21_OPIVI|nr:hypothetical protein T265_12871 [Opisthorchis viverrini]KER32013.1 hypothetical protein T265_12871 [Opisthorchis viverrini]